VTPAPDRSNAGAVLRFAVAGIGNTVLTGTLLTVLTRVVDPAVAYTIAFGTGIAMSTVLAGTFVFRQKLSAPRVIAYVTLYIVVYLAGLAALRAALALGLPPELSGAVILITAPLAFLGGRVIFWTLGEGLRPRTRPAVTETTAETEALP